jgi:hypothetical protein
MSMLERFRTGGVSLRGVRRPVGFLAQYGLVLLLICVAAYLLGWHIVRAIGLFVIVVAALIASA